MRAHKHSRMQVKLVDKPLLSLCLLPAQISNHGINFCLVHFLPVNALFLLGLCKTRLYLILMVSLECIFQVLDSDVHGGLSMSHEQEL